MIRPLAFFASLAACALASCAPAQPPAASPEPSQPTSFTLGPPHEQTPADGEMVAIGRAEAEIDRLFPEASAADAAPRKVGKGAPLPSATPDADADGHADKPAAKKRDEEPGSPGPASAGERCAVACKALASMGASADHLCTLAGEGDGRCDDARARVRGASARVRSACPGCAVSAGAPAGSPPAPPRQHGG